jgi:hypothetical protein
MGPHWLLRPYKGSGCLQLQYLELAKEAGIPLPGVIKAANVSRVARPTAHYPYRLNPGQHAYVLSVRNRGALVC